MYGIVLDDSVEFDASTFAARLAEAGVQTRPFFVGMHEQPVFLERGLFAGERYPVAERLARRGLYLPSGTALADAQAEAVIDAVRGVFAFCGGTTPSAAGRNRENRRRPDTGPVLGWHLPVLGHAARGDCRPGASR
jgi:hypothetical protein